MPDNIYKFGSFLLNASRRELQVPVTGRPMDLLLYLVRHAGEAIPRKTLIREVWQTEVTDGALTQQLGTLRGLLRETVAAPDFIETTGDRHVRFKCPVVIVSETPPSGDPNGPAIGEPSEPAA